MHTRTRVRNARARTRVERKNMFKHLKKIEKCLERLVNIEYEKNELLKKDMENEERFKTNYLEIMGETSNQLVAKIGE